MARSLARLHPDRLRCRRIGRSGEGRPLLAVTATDRRVPDHDKQRVLVLAGRHGNEESGRIIALELLSWLCTAAARGVMRRQVVTVLPNCNPDACERDIYRTPSGADVGSDLEEADPIPESRAIESVAVRLMPDCVVDLHACGHTGHASDMVLYPEPRPYTEDDNLLHGMAAAMCAAGERAGTPHVTHPLTWWDRGRDLGSCARYYRNYKSLPLLTETSEHNSVTPSAALRGRVGLARLRALLAWGGRRHSKLPYAGYPNQLVLGTWALGVAALGRTAAERRLSRVDIWRQADHFPRISYALPAAERARTILLPYTGQPLRRGLAVQCAFGGIRRVRSAALDGRPAAHRCWRSGGHTFVQVVLPILAEGEHAVDIRV